MKEKDSFLCFGNFPEFNSLLEAVNAFTENDWLAYTERKKTGGIASAYSETIPLIYNPKIRNGQLVYHKNYEPFSMYIDLVISSAFPYLGRLEVTQAMLTRLQSKSIINTHKDKGEITAKSHRIHVPIITNEQCIFTIEGEERNLKAGEIWMIDNTDRFHSVVNNGDEDRVHLIVDAKEM
jgi:hypothetical protein